MLLVSSMLIAPFVVKIERRLTLKKSKFSFTMGYRGGTLQPAGTSPPNQSSQTPNRICIHLFIGHPNLLQLQQGNKKP
jgi:hypothetical protein